MSKLKIYIFILSFFYFGTGGFFLGLIPGSEKIYRYLIVLFQGILILAAFSSITQQRKLFNTKILKLFLIVSTMTFLYNIYNVGLLTHLNGLRDPLTFISALILAESIFNSNYSNYFNKIFTKSLIIFVLLQVPVSLNQYFQYGAGDFVSGTLSFADLGGGSGILTQSLFLSSFFLFLNYGYKTEASFNYRKLIIFIILLLPIAINETKISFFLLPLYLSLLFTGRGKITTFILGIMVLAIIMKIYYNVYVSNTPHQIRVLENVNDFLNYYVSVNTHSSNITRLGKVTLLLDRYSRYFLDSVFGLGYGITKGQHILGQSRIGVSLQYLFQGSVILFFVSMLTGGVLLTLVLGFANFYKLFLIKKDELRKGIWLFKWFLIVVSIASWFYNRFVFHPFLGMLVAYLIVWVQFSKNKLIKNIS